MTHLHEHGLILWFKKYFYFLERSSLRATDNLCFSASESGFPFLYARFAPDEEVTAFSVCDISPPQYLNRDRFAEDTTVF